MMDPAKPHLVTEVKTLLKANIIDVAIMLASTIYLYQLVDVALNKPIKNHICNSLANWMLNESSKKGKTKKKNYHHPYCIDALDWY